MKVHQLFHFVVNLKEKCNNKITKKNVWKKIENELQNLFIISFSDIMSTAAVEPNLVKMDTVAMEEVNNNNFQERVVGKKAVNPAFSSNLDPMTTPSTVVDDDLVSDNINQKEVEDDSSTNSINEAIENASSTAAASTQWVKKISLKKAYIGKMKFNFNKFFAFACK